VSARAFPHDSWPAHCTSRAPICSRSQTGLAWCHRVSSLCESPRRVIAGVDVHVREDMYWKGNTYVPRRLVYPAAGAESEMGLKHLPGTLRACTRLHFTLWLSHWPTNKVLVKKLFVQYRFIFRWYKPNYENAESLGWGKNLGCDFVKNSCLYWMEKHKNR
jgi:hypothetical protein